MFKILCVTNRALCGGDFLEQIGKIAQSGAGGIILREKDLSEGEYRSLAGKVMEICGQHGTPCILHSFAGGAASLGASAIHLPLPRLRELAPAQRAAFRTVGASCHSLADAEEAEKLGCAYVTLGHIFPPDCKKGLPPRGLELLREVCAAVSVPVFAIGGISAENIAAVKEAGAAGACVMSGFMRCADPAAYLREFRKAGDIDEIQP